jgi:hypothetical protein
VFVLGVEKVKSPVPARVNAVVSLEMWSVASVVGGGFVEKAVYCG